MADLAASEQEVEGVRLIWTQLPPKMDEIIRKASGLHLRSLQGDVYLIQDVVTKHQAVSQKVIDRCTEGAGVMRSIDRLLAGAAAFYRRSQQGGLQ
jgi:hypothetical protein